MTREVIPQTLKSGRDATHVVLVIGVVVVVVGPAVVVDVAGAGIVLVVVVVVVVAGGITKRSSTYTSVPAGWSTVISASWS